MHRDKEQDAAWRESVYWALIGSGKEPSAERFKRCGSPCKLSCADCGTGRTIAQWCELRICPDCSARRALEIRHRVAHLLELAPATDGQRGKELTLTVQTNGQFHDAVRRITRALPRLWKYYLWRDVAGQRWKDAKRQAGEKVCVTGAVCGLEFGPKNGNVHAHMLFIGPYLPFLELQREWRRVAGEGSVFVCATGTTSSALTEIIKYMSDLKKVPGPRLVELYQTLEGKRRIRSYGILRGVESDELAGGEAPACAQCGGHDWLTEKGLEWMLKRAQSDPGPGEAA